MNWCQYILFRLFLFSCSDVQENTDISLTRINMSIKKSADNGKTWSAGYMSYIVGLRLFKCSLINEIGILYENGSSKLYEKISFERIRI